MYSPLTDETRTDVQNAFLKNELKAIGRTREGAALTWKNVSVSIKLKEEKCFGFKSRTYRKRIIDNVSGAVLPGNLVALMGPSGSGKSTILGALSRRFQGGAQVTGEIRFNGELADNAMKFRSGYMFQEDFFVPCLTVTEHLKFMAKLKMDRRSSSRQKERRVEALIEVLGLSAVRNSRIGGTAAEGEKSVISGGEKKRLSLATAMITLPEFLFVDEVTSGLDSFTAVRLVSLMKTIVTSSGSSLLATIHQPSPEILEMFDSVILIAEGQLAFIGRPNDAVEFFQSCGFSLNEGMSQGDFLLSCLGRGTGSTRPEVLKLVENFTSTEYFDEVKTVIDHYEQGYECYYPKPTILHFHFSIPPHSRGRKCNALPIGSLNFESAPKLREFWFKNEFQNDKTLQNGLFLKSEFWFIKLYWLFIRGCIEIIRNPELQWIRIFQKLLIAITAGLCYAGTIELDQKGVQAVQGVLFLFVTENTFAPMYAVMSLFPKELPLFLREHSNGTYDSFSYYVAKILYTMPGVVLESIVFTSCLYWLAGLRLELEPFLTVNLFTILCIFVSSSCGTFFSNTFESIPKAMTYLVPFEYIAMSTSGLFLRLDSLSYLTSWLKYVSWLLYTYESMTIAVWDGVNGISCPITNSTLTCFTNGNEVLDHFGFSVDHLLRNGLALIGLFLGFHLLGYIFFVNKIKKIV